MRRLALALVLCVGIAAPLEAQPVAGNACSGNVIGAATLTVACTVSGANTLLVCGISWYEAGLGRTINTVTHNGDALTQVTGSPAPANSEFQAGMWFRVAPDNGGPFDVVFTPSAATDMSGGCVTVTGADQATTFDTWAEASGTSGAPTVDVGSAAGDLVINILGWDGFTAASNLTANGAGQTQQWTEDQDGANGVMTTEAGATTVTMSHTLSPGSPAWSIGGISINPSAAGGAVPGRILTMGIGEPR